MKNTEKRSWLNNTILFFIFLIGLVILLSVVGSLLNVEGTYSRLNTVTGEVDNFLVSVESLFSREGARYIIGNTLSTFMSFTPLVMFLFSMIGVGFAEKTGLFRALFSRKKTKINKFFLSFIIAFLSILSTIIGDIGFVIVVPLAAIIFLANNRNPIIGIINSFAAITAGYGINVVVSQMDYNLFELTNLSANLVDKTYNVSINGNLIFTSVTSVLMAFLIAFITEKFTVKKAKKYRIDEMIDDEPLSKNEIKGLRCASIFAIFSLLFFVYMLIPFGTPLAGLLLDYDELDFYGRVFSSNSYVIQGLSFIICTTLIICGWIYGTIAKTIKNKNDFSTYIYDSLNNIGSILVLFFMAAELIALLRKSNIGTVVTIKVINILNTLSFSGISLILLLFILIVIANIFQTTATTKWSILSPSIVPMMMKANISPEFTQIIFRVADSATNIISPFFPYFVVLIGMLQVYNKQEEAIGIKYTYKLLFPYLLGVLLFWIIILICWYILNVPVGVGAYPTL